MNFSKQLQGKCDESNRSRHEVNENVFTLSVNPSEYFNLFPTVEKPCRIGSFSEDGQGIFHNNNDMARYFIAPKNENVYFNLRHGYETMIRMDESVNALLDSLLKFLITDQYRNGIYAQMHQSFTPQFGR